MKDKIKQYFVSFPTRVKDYFKKLNYPFYIGMVVLAVGLFLTDYFSKHIAFEYMTNGDIDNLVINTNRIGTTIIPGLINLTYTANDGAAWGSFSGKMWALCIVSFIASIALTVNLLFRFNKYNIWMTIGITLMAPGAIGNLVDRMGCLTQSGIYKKGVIDFLQFTFWPGFPICNLADYYLTIGVVFLLVGFVLEFKKEYREMKEEEKKEKEAAAMNIEGSDSADDDMKKKLADMDKNNDNNKDEVNDESDGK